MIRGYFGVAILNGKTVHNYGTLMRTAQLLDAGFIAIIGKRFKRQASDTMASHRHVPTFEYATFEEFYKNLPYDCRLIGIELDEKAIELKDFSHPERAVYLLGAEDNGLTKEAMGKCHAMVKLKGERSMNMAVAGSIVLYHRTAL